MRLVFSPVHIAWVFMFGDAITRMGDWPMFFPERCSAVWAAKECGLAVSPRGRLSSI